MHDTDEVQRCQLCRRHLNRSGCCPECASVPYAPMAGADRLADQCPTCSHRGEEESHDTGCPNSDA